MHLLVCLPAYTIGAVVRLVKSCNQKWFIAAVTSELHCKHVHVAQNNQSVCPTLYSQTLFIIDLTHSRIKVSRRPYM